MESYLFFKTVFAMKQYYKHFFFSVVAASLLFCYGCKKQNETKLANVNVKVADFSITQDEFPDGKSSDIGDYSGVKAIMLAFYNGDTEAYKHTQIRVDSSTYTTFGSFNCALPMANYTMVVLGFGYVDGDTLVLTSPTEAVYTSEHPRETFASTKAVAITNTEDLAITDTLSRIIAKVNVVSTDIKTENASTVRTTFSAGGKDFNPTTGLAITNTGFDNTVGATIPPGVTTISINYIFLASDEQTMDIEIDVLDTDGNSISHKEVPNVPLRRNRITTLTGSIYNADAASNFLIDTDWLPGNDVPF